jgi:hypothetical protein
MSVLTLRPNSDDALNVATIVTGANGWAVVDEAVEDTADYINVNSVMDWTYGDATFGFPDHTTETGRIKGIKVTARAAMSSAYNALLKLRIKLGASYFDVGAQVLTTSSATYAVTFYHNPATGALWSWSDVDALVCGVYLAADRTNARCYQLWVEVEYYADEVGPQTVILRPVSDNGGQGWTITPADPATHFDKVSEVTKDLSTYITSPVTAQTDSFNIAAPPSGTTGLIKGMVLHAVVMHNDTGDWMEYGSGEEYHRWFIGPSTATALPWSSVATEQEIELYFPVNPSTGVVWTWADLASLTVTLHNHSGAPYIEVYQLWVEIDYLSVLDGASCFGKSSGYAVAVGHVSPTLTGAIASKQAQIANVESFATTLTDSGELTATESADENTTIVLTWTPSAAGKYYLRVGAHRAAESAIIWGPVVAFLVAFPTITSTAVTQSGAVFTWTIVVADSYSNPPTGLLIVDGKAQETSITSIGAGSYTYASTVTLARGKHLWRLQISNVWQQLNTTEQQLFADYPARTPGIELYVGNAHIEAWDAVLSDALLPELPTLSFTSSAWIAGGQEVTAVCSLRGAQTYSFVRRYATKQTDGAYSYRCDATEKNVFDEVMTLRANALGVEEGMKQAIGSLRLADDYHSILSGLIHETSWEDVPRSEVINQLIIRAGVNAWCRHEMFYCAKQDVTALIARFAVRKHDVLTSFSEDARTYNWVRVWYSVKQYPVVETALTNYDAAQWTGTVANALRNGSGLLPKSEASYCLQGTGAITRAGLLGNISDFDRIKLRWCPPAGTSSLSITIQTDASNKLVGTRTFAGGTGAGFILTGATESSATVTKTITLSDQRIVSVVGEMSAPCFVTMTLKSRGATVWTSDVMRTVGASNVFTIFVPYSQTSATADSMELAFTNLYVVSNAYGVSCVRLAIEEYKQTTVITGSSSYVVSSSSKAFSLPITVTLTSFTCGKTLICAIPSVTGSQTTSYDIVNAIIWGYVYAADMTLVAAQVGGGFRIFEENGNLYATAGSVTKGSTVGGVATLSSARGTAIVKVIEQTHTSQQVWAVSSYAWSSSYNLWDEVDLPLSAFTKTGSPTTLNTIILSATGANCYDGLMLYANQPLKKYAEAKSGDGLHKMPDRTGDGFGSENGARAFAEGLLAIVATPVKDYGIRKPLDTDVALGDPVDCDGENLAVYGINYDFTAGEMIVCVGKRVQETLEVLKSHAERIDRLESGR